MRQGLCILVFLVFPNVTLSYGGERSRRYETGILAATSVHAIGAREGASGAIPIFTHEYEIKTADTVFWGVCVSRERGGPFGVSDLNRAVEFRVEDRTLSVKRTNGRDLQLFIQTKLRVINTTDRNGRARRSLKNVPLRDSRLMRIPDCT